MGYNRITYTLFMKLNSTHINHYVDHRVIIYGHTDLLISYVKVYELLVKNPDFHYYLLPISLIRQNSTNTNEVLLLIILLYKF